MWVDASNYTGPLTDGQCQELKAAGVVGVIIQAITGLDNNSYTRQQLAACVRNGLLIAGYVFPGDLVTKLAMFNGYVLRSLWLDIELPISIGAVDSVLMQCDAYFGGLTGIYTGKWFFDQMWWSTLNLWSTRPLWDSNYDGDGNLLTDFRPYGGWTIPTIKQYAGTSSIGNVHQIDLDVM